MKLPGFTAGAAAVQKNSYSRHYGYTASEATLQLQDCGVLKKFGCITGPFSWCALASLGGSDPYLACVDKLSGGNCLECIEGGLDYRNRKLRQPFPDPETDPQLNKSTNPLTSSTGPDQQLDSINRKLDALRRCACPTPLAWLPVNRDIAG